MRHAKDIPSLDSALHEQTNKYNNNACRSFDIRSSDATVSPEFTARLDYSSLA